MPDQFEKYISSIIERSDTYLSDALLENERFASNNNTSDVDYFINDILKCSVSMPTSHLFSGTGKRWRTLISVIILDSLCANTPERENAMVSIAELIHTGSLIIDDVQDASIRRRGLLSVHTAYDVPLAINAGNLLYFMPLGRIAQISDIGFEQKCQIYSELVNYFCMSHVGQAFDIEMGRADRAIHLFGLPVTSSTKIVESTYIRKTASWPMGLATVASIMANAPTPVTEAFLHFSRALGLAFQISDDIMDVIGSPTYSKSIGDDIKNGKPTYVNLVAASLLSTQEREQFVDIVVDRTASRDEQAMIKAFDLIKSSGAIPHCKAKITKLYEQAWHHLCTELPHSFERSALNTLCRSLIGLDAHSRTQTEMEDAFHT